MPDFHIHTVAELNVFRVERLADDVPAAEVAASALWYRQNAVEGRHNG